MTGKYVKGEDKEGTEKRIIKSKRIIKKKERYIQEREQQIDNVQKTDKNKNKKENFFLPTA